MTFKCTVASFAALAAVAVGAGPSFANDAGGVRLAAPTASTESGYVPTQYRGRGRGTYYVAPRRRNNTGRNVAIGVGAAILGGIIASEAVRANRSSNRCATWDYRCANGDGYSCRQLRRYC